MASKSWSLAKTLPELQKPVLEQEKEIWKDIPGMNGCYQASNIGRIRRIWVLKPWKTSLPASRKKNAQQRAVIALRMAEGKKNWYVHRLVAAAFIGRCPEGMEVNHIDGNPLNNRISNLEYVTRSQNIAHAWKMGLINPKPKMGRCAICDTPIWKRYKKKRFCSLACYGMSRRDRFFGVCKNCGVCFQRKKSKAGPFCSKGCERPMIFGRCINNSEDRPTNTASLFT